MRYQPFSINGRYLSLTTFNLFQFIIFLGNNFHRCLGFEGLHSFRENGGGGMYPLGWREPAPSCGKHPTGSDRASFLEQVSRDLALRDSSDAAVSRARIHEKHQKKRRKERSKRGGGERVGDFQLSWVSGGFGGSFFGWLGQIFFFGD